MASELFKNKALIQRLKEPDVPVVNFNLADSAKDYSIESIIEEISSTLTVASAETPNIVLNFLAAFPTALSPS